MGGDQSGARIAGLSQSDERKVSGVEAVPIVDLRTRLGFIRI